MKVRTYSAVIILIVASANTATCLHAANWQTDGSSTSGDWNDTAHWDTADIPDTATEAAVFPFISSGGPHTVTLNDTQYPGGLTVGSLNLNTGNNNVPLTRHTVVNATGGGGTLGWTVGDVANPGSLTMRRHAITLNNVNWSFLGTTTGNTMFLNGLSPSFAHDWNIDAVGSDISILAAPVGSSTVSALRLASGAGMRMSGGNLTVTNGTNDARVTVSGIDTTNSNREPVLMLTGTSFNTNQLVVSGGGQFTFDGTGQPGTSSVTGLVEMGSGGGDINLTGGDITFGSVLLSFPSTSASNKINVTGGDLTVTGNLDLKTTSSTPTGAFPNELNISSGSVTAAAMDVGGSSADKGAFAVNISAAGALSVAGQLQLGFDDTSTRHGAGTVVMTGGTLEADSLEVGADRGSDANSRGYYEQTGGVATYGTIELSRDNAGGSGYGTQQFVVGEGATLNVTGAGFSQVGNGDWNVGDDPGDLDFSGTLVFNPSAVTAQTLYAFGEDQGQTEFDSGEDLTAAIVNNFGVGTLDLSNLNGAEVLTILAAGNQLGAHSLYINSLLGVTDTDVTMHLDSTLNLYYNAGLSPGLDSQTFALNSGGQLIPLISVPEPSSLLLAGLGLVTLIRRRRRSVKK